VAISSAALGLCCLAGFTLAAQSLASSPARSASKKTVITVVMTEYHFAFSKSKNVPVGTVVFELKNHGKIPHDLQINGKTSKLIAPGKTGTLTVVFKKKGSYYYKCTVPGHAQLGMKGYLGIATSKTKTTTTTTTTTTTSSTTTVAQEACTSPTSTTVTVSMVDFSFTLSQNTVPCGTVTFDVTNNGQTSHDFVFQGLTTSPSGTALQSPGQSTTLTIDFTQTGAYTYICDVPGHERLGMVGTLTVTEP
jgi:uncharacterized cupredoxin-like copper-binding protein